MREITKEQVEKYAELENIEYVRFVIRKDYVLLTDETHDWDGVSRRKFNIHFKTILKTLF